MDAEDPLPGYTPSSNFGNCALDGLTSAYEKVVDVTYNRGTVTELTTRNDIGIATECLAQCSDAGPSCLAVLLRNERGGRQSCSSVTSSAVADNADPTSATGVTYFEKICISKFCFVCLWVEVQNICLFSSIKAQIYRRVFSKLKVLLTNLLKYFFVVFVDIFMEFHIPQNDFSVDFSPWPIYFLGSFC